MQRGNQRVCVCDGGAVLGNNSSREQLRRLIEIIPGGVIIADANGLILSANNAAERVFGLKRDDIIGRIYYDPALKITKIDGEPFEKDKFPIAQVMRTGLPVYGVELTIERRGGTAATVFANATPLFDENGVIEEIVSSFEDTTKYRQTEKGLTESECRLLELLEKINLAAFILDIRGNITFINDYLLDATGWTREEVVNKNWFSLFIPPDQRGEIGHFFYESIAKGEIEAHYENDVVTREGMMRTLSFNNVFLRDNQGNITGTASIGEDITERELAAEEIRESRRQVLDTLEYR